jgi:hypothetical protein
MKVAVIGDIHGTTKFLECYKNIQETDSDSQLLNFGLQDLQINTVLMKRHLNSKHLTL